MIFRLFYTEITVNPQSLLIVLTKTSKQTLSTAAAAAGEHDSDQTEMNKSFTSPRSRSLNPLIKAKRIKLQIISFFFLSVKSREHSNALTLNVPVCVI